MSKLRIAVTLAIVAAVLFGGLRLLGPVRPPPGVTMKDLGGIEALRTRFNAAAGKPRVIFVLSPT